MIAFNNDTYWTKFNEFMGDMEKQIELFNYWVADEFKPLTGDDMLDVALHLEYISLCNCEVCTDACPSNNINVFKYIRFIGEDQDLQVIDELGKIFNTECVTMIINIDNI